MTQPPSIPRPDYATPWPAPSSHGISWPVFASHLSGWALGTVVLLIPCLFILPRYERALADYNAPVPAVTAFAIAAARLVRDYWGLLTPIGLVHATLVALWYPRAKINARRLYRLLLTLFVAALFATVIFALFLPIVSITNSLSGATPKK